MHDWLNILGTALFLSLLVCACVVVWCRQAVRVDNLHDRIARAEQSLHRAQVRLEQLRQAVDRQDDVAAAKAKLAAKMPSRA
jgi:hypothetical protein